MQTTAKQYARRWADTLKRTPAKDWGVVSDRLLRSLQAHADQGMMDEIQTEMKSLLQSHVVPVHVTSARPLTKETRTHMLKQLLGEQNLLITQAVDPSLIGGAVVRTTDEQWDLSVKHQLERLKRSIIES